MISHRGCAGEPLGGGSGEDPDRGRGEDQAGLDRAVVVDLLQVYGDGEEASLQDEPLDCLGAQPQVGDLVAEQAQRQQHIPALFLTDRTCRKNHSRNSAPIATYSHTGEMSARYHHVRMVKWDWEGKWMRGDTANKPAADSTAPVRSNRGLDPEGAGSVILRASTMIQATTRTCRPNEARQLSALVTSPPISGPAAAPGRPHR